MPGANEAQLATKLNIKEGVPVRVIGQPADVALPGLDVTSATDAPAVIAFVRTLAEVDALAGPVVQAAKKDSVAWLAYPKGGKLGTDLNRDILWKRMTEEGVRPVRNVAIDHVWSALRFRPER